MKILLIALTVSARKTLGKIESRVTDNVHEMPASIISRISQPVFTTKPTGQGTGLGLSLSHDMVTDGHGGELAAETKEGAGTIFIIRSHIKGQQ